MQITYTHTHTHIHTVAEHDFPKNNALNLMHVVVMPTHVIMDLGNYSHPQSLCSPIQMSHSSTYKMLITINIHIWVKRCSISLNYHLPIFRKWLNKKGKLPCPNLCNYIKLEKSQTAINHVCQWNA